MAMNVHRSYGVASSSSSMVRREDKKRKPSRDFPAHSTVPVGKAAHHQLHATANGSSRTPRAPPMPDPHNILHYPRSESMLSTGSRMSMLSMDDNFELAGGEQIMEDEDHHHHHHHHSSSENDDDNRGSLNLPKHERPPQPADEREYFERLWAANFERSEAQVANTTAYIPAGCAGRLNRIKGFSFARDATTHRLYAVFRLEIECIANEKQWTIYRRFHDFKTLAHQLKTHGVRLTPVPTRTLMRSLDTTFLKRRQLELDRWLREVLMLVSIDNCKVDSEHASDCCGQKGLHASARIIRTFLTQSANQPPAFEAVEVAHAPARPPLHSVADVSTSQSRQRNALPSSSSNRVDAGPQADLDQLSSSLRRSDLMGTTTSASAVRRSASTSSVVVEDLDNPHTVTALRRDGRVLLHEFDVLRLIGRGSFGKVLLVRKKHSSQLFAVKVLSKAGIVQKQQVEHTRTERRVLASVHHPFVVALHYAFQTKDKLFFVLDYCPGGDLFFHLSRCGCFPEPMAKFYAAEIALALIHLHEQGIVYRDLKPENIMLDVDGHVKLADFGLAKEGITSQLDGTYTMCGTPEYLPPEILNRNGHGTAVDWWNLGMVLYEMLTGRPPWYTQDREELFTRLREAALEFPPNSMSHEAMDLIRGLLTRDPARRLGALDPREITYHPFFAEIDWNLLYHREVQPLYRPCQYTDPIDAANFEEEFTKLPLAQLESDGLSIASDVAQQPPTATTVQFAAAPMVNGHANANGANTNSTNANGAATGSSARNSTLRNLSYTFAGFTFEGASFAPHSNGSDATPTGYR